MELCIDKFVAKQISTDIAAWNENILPCILNEYSPNDIFKADEFGLFLN